MKTGMIYHAKGNEKKLLNKRLRRNLEGIPHTTGSNGSLAREDFPCKRKWKLTKGKQVWE